MSDPFPARPKNLTAQVNFVVLTTLRLYSAVLFRPWSKRALRLVLQLEIDGSVK
jgi:hypothetical protein